MITSTRKSISVGVSAVQVLGGADEDGHMGDAEVSAPTQQVVQVFADMAWQRRRNCQPSLEAYGVQAEGDGVDSHAEVLLCLSVRADRRPSVGPSSRKPRIVSAASIPAAVSDEARFP